MIVESIEGARRGDPGDRDRLIAEVWPHAFRIALTILRDSALAEDAAQEACATVYVSVSRLRSPAAFRVWFYRIVVRHAMAIRRRSDWFRAAGDVVSNSPHPDGSVVRIDVQAALARLSPVQRTAVVLHYYAELNSREISAVLGIPDSSVRFHLMRAKRALERILGDGESVRPVLTEVAAGAI